VFRTEGETVTCKVKYALVAHERGSDYYVAVSTNGNLMACDQEFLNSLRISESLTFFDDVYENIAKQQEQFERTGIFPPGTAADHSIKQLYDLLTEIILLLDFPLKENVEFFSLPKNIVENLRWIPRQIAKYP
jgi:hypothetical protein